MTLSVHVGFQRNGFTLDARLSAGSRETVALLGPNGSGKSTLLSILAGLLAPDSGLVELDGRVLDNPAASIHVAANRRPVGVVFQQLLLFPHMSVLENVAFPLLARGSARGQARADAAAMLEEVGASGLADNRPMELSGGQAQQVALARALVSRPRLLLLDEPLSALDVSARGRVRTLLRRTLTASDAVRILVTHDPVDAMTLADRIVILEDGRTTQEGAPAELRASPRSRYAADLVGLNMFRGQLEALDRGTAVLHTEDGDIVVPSESGGSRMAHAVATIALLRPSDVALHRGRPEGSARNVFGGIVRSVSIEGERARVVLATSPRLTAEVTPASVSALGIREGEMLWASFKALEVQVVDA